MKKFKYLGLLVIPLFLIIGYLVVDSFLFDGIKAKEIVDEGFQANFFAKPELKNKPTIVLIGGGHWGDHWGREFANREWVSLSLPYMGQPNLAPSMEEVPLEYFETAIHWLIEQPEVASDKIIVMGASRNAELSLVIASSFPDLISGVIAFAPSAISWSNTVLPYNSDSLKPSWTYLDQAIPYLPMEKIKGTDSPKIETLNYWMSGLEKVEQYQESIIKVERIKGPILLLSGRDDKIWPASIMSNMIAERLAANDFQFDFENIQYENAGHLISRNITTISDERIGHMKIDGQDYEFEFGGSIEGDKSAILQSQEKIFSLIQKYESR